MVLDRYAGAVRANLIRAMGGRARLRATVLRAGGDPFAATEPEEIGVICGYRYTKRGDAALRMGLPGELADEFDTEWMLDLTEGLPVSCQKGDVLRFDNDERRIASARDGVAGIYRLYRLEKETFSNEKVCREATVPAQTEDLSWNTGVTA